MAEVTVNLIEHQPGGINGLTMIIANIGIANSGDTWTHGLRATVAQGFNDTAITKMSGTANQATLASTGAVVAAQVWVLGYA